MRVKVLGSAAGGGFPQWNCGCPNCRRFRLGTIRAVPRSQAQLAVTTDDQHWFLLGASPDLLYQIRDSPELQPRQPGRNSPISGVVLAGADLDHVLGLLLLREWQRLCVYSTATVRRLLLENNSVFRLLQRMPGQILWTDVSIAQAFSLTSPDGLKSGITARFFGLPGHLPSYSTECSGLSVQEAVVALLLQSPSGAHTAFIPGLPEISDALLDELGGCHTILVDGTFWTNDELVRIEGFGGFARDIGHTPISGSEGSLSRLSGLSTPRKIYMHINNTNPILDENSEEHRFVRESGWEIAYDGMEFTL